ncbi:hypothetical protein TNCT_248031, partial [Trichonephila clavata]
CDTIFSKELLLNTGVEKLNMPSSCGQKIGLIFHEKLVMHSTAPMNTPFSIRDLSTTQEKSHHLDLNVNWVHIHILNFDTHHR